MPDIVWNVRERALQAACDGEPDLGNLLGSAAAEIERLRSALTRQEDRDGHIGTPSLGLTDRLRNRGTFMDEEAAAEISRLRAALRHQEDRDGHIGTHSDNCHTFGPRHYDCALREIESLRLSLITSAGETQAALDRVAELEPDALRYRHLRVQPFDEVRDLFALHGTGQQRDSAIDAARGT